MGISALAGLLLVGGVVMSQDGAGSARAAGSGHGGTGQLGGSGWGGGGRGGAMLTVTGVSGNTITATTRQNQTVTITVTGSTKCGEAGQTVACNTIQTGEHIAVQGLKPGQTSITATSIQIVLPTDFGTVVTVTPSTITLKGRNNSTQTVIVNGSTRYQKGGQPASLTDVTPGTNVVAQGTSNSDGSITALLINIQVPTVMGKVTAMGTDSYTVAGFRGNTSFTVLTTGSTVYVNPNGSPAQQSAITDGTMISAQGTFSADGKTLTATRIVILPAFSGGPRSHHAPAPA